MSCSIADPYVLLMSEEGQVMLMTLKEDQYGGGVRLAVKRPELHYVSCIDHRDLVVNMKGKFRIFAFLNGQFILKW